MGATAKKTALTLRKKLDRFFYVLAKKLFQTGKPEKIDEFCTTNESIISKIDN